jgi:thymidine phosphorylase
VRDFCLEESAELLLLAGRARDRRAALAAAERTVADGSALALLARVVEAQGGDRHQIEDPSALPAAPVIHVVGAPRAGYIARIEALAVGRLAMALGAGRAAKHHPVRHDTGVLLLRIHGDLVKRGEPIAEIHAGSVAAAESGAQALLDAITSSDDAPPARRLLLGRIR